MVDAIFHVGAPKCGSSALQRFLSHNPALSTTDDRTLAYMCLRRNAAVPISGDALKSASSMDERRYLVSDDISGVTCGAYLDRLRLVIPELNNHGIVPIFSLEDWYEKAALFLNNSIFERIDIDIEILLYVRPQIPLMNSAWWQWGAWSNIDFEQWIRQSLDSYRWADIVEAYESLPRVKNVRVRILPADIIRDFLNVYNVVGDYSEYEWPINTSLPGVILRLFQRNRELRKGPHDSKIDFILERYFCTLNSTTPWVIDNQLMQLVASAYRTNNEALLQMLEPDQQRQMWNDERWWGAYDPGKPAVSPHATNLDLQELEELAVLALQHIRDLEPALTTSLCHIDELHGSGCGALHHSFYRLGTEYENRGELTKAIKAIRSAIDLEENSHYCCYLGSLLAEQGDLDGAEQAQLRAVRIDPHIPWPYLELGRLYFRRNQIDKAVDAMRVAVDLQEDSECYRFLGVLMIKQGELDDAERVLRRAIELDPGAPRARFELSRLLSGKKRIDEAVEEVRTAIRLKSDEPGFHLHLGNLLLDRGELAGAREALQRAEKLNFTNDKSYASLTGPPQRRRA